MYNYYSFIFHLIKTPLINLRILIIFSKTVLLTFEAYFSVKIVQHCSKCIVHLSATNSKINVLNVS